MPGSKGNATINSLPILRKWFIVCQAKAWVDELMFMLWILEIWKPWRTAISHDSQPSYLLIDEFQVCLMATSLNAIKDCGTAMDFVCGYTSKLQVLDISGKQAL